MKRLLAPNGNTSNLNDKQYKLVRTTSFKKWFGDWEVLAEAKTLSNDIKGVYKFVALDNIERFLFEISQQANSSNSELNGAIKTVGKRIVELSLKLFPNSKVGDEYIPVVSKVIDDNGEPLVCYHGTNIEFNIFEKQEIDGFNAFGEVFYFTDRLSDAESYGNYVKNVFLNLKSIYNIQKNLNNYQQDLLEKTSNIQNKYDGVEVYKNNTNIFVAFNPNQIKLADGSNTTFDANKNDIRYKNGGALNNKSTSVIVYHGSTRQFDEFDNSKLGEATKSKSAKFGFWFTDDIETAKSYPRAENWNKVQYFIDNNEMELAEKLENDIDKNKDIKYLKKVRLTYKNPLIIDAEENVYNDFSNEIEDAIKIAIENKNDVLIVERLSDNADYSEYTPANHYLVLDNSIIEIISENKFNNGGNVLLAPNGKVSKLTPEQYKLVRTPAFKKWFGDWENDPENSSKVIDEETKEPLIVYHGSYFNGNIFKVKYNNDGVGLIYFSNKKIVAEKYGIIREFFLKVQNLDEIDLDYRGFNDAYDNTWLNTYLRKTEDGLLMLNIYDDPSGKKKGKLSNVYAVKYPNQIKLADGSNTTFDENNDDIRFDNGGRTIAQTPAPKNERIYGSNTNKEKSSESNASAKQIVFNENTMKSIKNKVDKHNEENPNKKITLSSAKAVVRRGMGAYSSSHRPTIKGGKPNSRVAWGLARLNAFIYKIKNGVSKSGKYTQDDDLIDELNIKYNIGGDVSDASFNNVKNDKTNYLDVLKDIWSNFNIKF